jgi:Tfp pilus assembly protein PilO
MVANKALIYKPGVHTDSLSRKEVKAKKKKKVEKVSLKEVIKEFLINGVLLFLGILTFVFTVGICYKIFILTKLKIENHRLAQENKELKRQYQLLTSRDVVLTKAKKLGLRPPEKNDYLGLE